MPIQVEKIWKEKLIGSVDVQCCLYNEPCSMLEVIFENDEVVICDIVKLQCLDISPRKWLNNFKDEIIKKYYKPIQMNMFDVMVDECKRRQRCISS